MTQSPQSPPDFDGLHANRHRVSVHKYGFFLCRAGTARILLGPDVYRISRNHLCIYTPNTFFRILEKSRDLDGILEEDEVSAYYPAVSSIPIRERLRIRHSPCVGVTEAQAASLAGLYERIRESGQPAAAEGESPESPGKTAETLRAGRLRHLRYALCLEVLETYFRNAPVEAVPRHRDDAILNRFLAAVYGNCQRQRTVGYYAGLQHLSPDYFSALIRERSGKSALQWIGDVTMIFARQYLACSQLSVKEIAGRLNFPDPSTFGRYFRQREGCTPSEFRRRLLEAP